MNKGQNGTADKSDDEIAAEVVQMLRDADQTIPITEAEVERFEKQMEAKKHTLPARLLDVKTAFAAVSGERKRPLKLQQPGNSEVEQLLARAAREGGNVSEEVEKRMREDRKRAQQNASVDDKKQ